MKLITNIMQKFNAQVRRAHAEQENFNKFLEDVVEKHGLKELDKGLENIYKDRGMYYTPLQNRAEPANVCHKLMAISTEQPPHSELTKKSKEKQPVQSS